MTTNSFDQQDPSDEIKGEKWSNPYFHLKSDSRSQHLGESSLWPGTELLYQRHLASRILSEVSTQKY